ncbi:hypothetical protein D3C85_1487870 [compost metagenome]
MHATTADELHERARIGQSSPLAVQEQAVGDAIGREEERQAEATIEIEQAEKLLGDRLKHPPAQVVMQ